MMPQCNLDKKLMLYVSSAITLYVYEEKFLSVAFQKAEEKNDMLQIF